MFVASIILFAFAGSLFGGGSAPATPPRGQIDYIESRLRLPDDALGPLSKYHRYYAWTLDNGKKYIYAVYVFEGLIGPEQRSPGTDHIHAVTEQAIPAVTNGGCGVITFYVDPRADRTPSLYCNAVGPVSFSKN